MPSGSDEARVQATGLCHICCALNNCASVGKDGEDILVVFKPQKHIVMPHGAVRAKALLHLYKVYRAVAFVYLYGIASAECDVRPALSPEMGEIALLADFAVLTGVLSGDFRAVVCPEIK